MNTETGRILTDQEATNIEAPDMNHEDFIAVLDQTESSMYLFETYLVPFMQQACVRNAEGYAANGTMNSAAWQLVNFFHQQAGPQGFNAKQKSQAANAIIRAFGTIKKHREAVAQGDEQASKLEDWYTRNDIAQRDAAELCRVADEIYTSFNNKSALQRTNSPVRKGEIDAETVAFLREAGVKAPETAETDAKLIKLLQNRDNLLRLKNAANVQRAEAEASGDRVDLELAMNNLRAFDEQLNTVKRKIAKRKAKLSA